MFKFSLDQFLNPHIWPSQVYRFPQPLRRFMGGSQPKPVSDYWLWLDILLGTFCGIAIIEAVFKLHTAFTEHHPPLIIASYGASAILCFNATASPLAQPRNVIMGQFVSSLIGICIEKLFSLSEAGRENYWAGGALSVAISSVAMTVLNCVHPPGGASALLPCADAKVRAMGWWYLPAQLVSSVLMLAVACLVNNIIRSYPVFWWTVGTIDKHPVVVEPENIEESSVTLSRYPLVKAASELPNIQFVADRTTIDISDGHVLVPEGLELEGLEMEWLASLQKLLTKAAPDVASVNLERRLSRQSHFN